MFIIQIFSGLSLLLSSMGLVGYMATGGQNDWGGEPAPGEFGKTTKKLVYWFIISLLLFLVTTYLNH